MRVRLLLLGVLVLLPVSVAAHESTVSPDGNVDALLLRAERGERDERRDAMDSLLGRDDARLSGRVLAILDRTKDDGIVEDLLRGIGRHEVEAGLAPAIERLDHRAPGVRSHAAVCLERLGREDAVAPLLQRAGKEKDVVVLKNVLRALGRTGANRSDVASSLVKRFRHKDGIVAANAILACSGFTEEGRVRSIVAGKIGDMLARTSEIRIRWACVCALGRMGTTKEIPDLEKYVDGFRGSLNPFVQPAIRAANLAIERIRTGTLDEPDGGAFDRFFRLASDDERDAARDGDPDKPVPAWLDRDPRKPPKRGNGHGGKWR